MAPGSRRIVKPLFMKQEPIDMDLFGATPRLIASGLGVRPELVLTYLTSVLGGMAGSFARIRGSMGGSQSPGLPLVLEERHPGRGRNLADVALGPVQHFNDWERRQLQAIIPEWHGEHHAFEVSKVKNTHKGFMTNLDSDMCVDHEIAGEQSVLWRYRQNWQPSVLLNSPEPGSFEKVLGSVFDACPLVVDLGGSVVRRVLEGQSQAGAWPGLLRRIVEGARGGFDAPLQANGPPVMNSTLRVRTPFLMHLPTYEVASALLHPVTAPLFEVAVLLPTERVAGGPATGAGLHAEASRVVGGYRDAVNRVLWSRLDGGGVDFSLIRPCPALLEGIDDIERTIERLPDSVRRLCGGLYGLPLRLLWTALVLDSPKGDATFAELVPGVMQTARWCVERQSERILEVLEEERLRSLREAAATMWRKLHSLSLPCRFSDLLRKYHRQRKEFLLPVLEFLREEQIVRCDSRHGGIELMPDHPMPSWLGPRAPSFMAVEAGDSPHGPA